MAIEPRPSDFHDASGRLKRVAAPGQDGHYASLAPGQWAAPSHLYDSKRVAPPQSATQEAAIEASLGAVNRLRPGDAGYDPAEDSSLNAPYDRDEIIRTGEVPEPRLAWLALKIRASRTDGKIRDIDQKLPGIQRRQDVAGHVAAAVLKQGDPRGYSYGSPGDPLRPVGREEKKTAREIERLFRKRAHAVAASHSLWTPIDVKAAQPSASKPGHMHPIAAVSAPGVDKKSTSADKSYARKNSSKHKKMVQHADEADHELDKIVTAHQKEGAELIAERTQLVLKKEGIQRAIVKRAAEKAARKQAPLRVPRRRPSA